MDAIPYRLHIPPGHHSPAFIRPSNSYRLSFSDSIIEQVDDEDISSNHTDSSNEKNTLIQPIGSIGGDFKRTFSENDLTSRYLTSSPTRLWAAPSPRPYHPLPSTYHQPTPPLSPPERTQERNTLFNINISLWAAFGAGVICTLIPSLWFMNSRSKSDLIRSRFSR